MSDYLPTRRHFLCGVLATAAGSILPAGSAFARPYDYLIVSDHLHEFVENEEVHSNNINLFGRSKNIRRFAQEGYKSIHLELPHDLAGLIRQGDYAIEQRISRLCRQYGVTDPFLVDANVSKYLQLAGVVRAATREAKKHGMTVHLFDPWSIKKIFSMTASKTEDDITTFLEERLHDRVHRAMARKIKQEKPPAVIFTGSQHSRALLSRLDGRVQIVTPRSVAIDNSLPTVPAFLPA